MKETENIDEMNFDLKTTFLIFRARLWLLLLSLLIGAGIGWLVSIGIDPVYEATTKVLVARSDQQSVSDVTSYLSDLQLAQTYLQLLTTQTVLDIVSDRTDIEFESEDIKAQVIRDTQVIEIVVENTNPRQAVLIANSLVGVLIEQNEFIQSARYKTMEESLKAQKTQIEKEIQNLQLQTESVTSQGVEEQKLWLESNISGLQAEKVTLQQEIEEINAASTEEGKLLLEQKSTRLEQVQSLLTLYQDNYNTLLSGYGGPLQPKIDLADSRLALLNTTQALYEQYYVSILGELESVNLARLQNVPNIVQIETASVPEEPIRPLPWLNVTLGAVIGFVFMIGVVFLREALDDTVKTRESIERVLEVPVIGSIGEMPRNKKDPRRVHIAQQPHSVVSEDFRLLRTNLELVSARKSMRTILITSPQDAEGKTTVAINLAASLARAEKRVVLLEADMRRPELQTEIGPGKPGGLITLLNNQTNVQSVACASPDLPNLAIIKAGEAPSNPAELLSSKKMLQILNELKEMADVVVIDSPPSFVADAQILAMNADAVLLVVRPGVTHVEAAQNSIELFKRAGTHIIGVVMNRVSINQVYDRSRKEYLAGNQ